MSGRIRGTTRPQAPFVRLVEQLSTRLDAEQLRLVERAHAVAAYWHRGQTRLSGDPYITHPVAVAAILADLGSDHETVCAGLLHDVLEDTACPAADLEREFGETISSLVRSLATLDDPARLPAEWVESADPRLLTIKLADRLHNQRTMRWIPSDRQRRKSLQTLEIFVPVAGLLGMHGIRRELEQLACARLASLARDGVRLSFRAVAAGALLLPAGARARWLEEWLHDLHALSGGRARARHAAQLLLGMPAMAAALRWPMASARGLLDVALRPLLRALRWVLGSDARVWALLTPPLAWLTVDVGAGRLGDAVAILITVPPVLAAGVRALRARLGVGARRRDDLR